MCLLLDVVALALIAVAFCSMLRGKPSVHYDIDRGAFPVKGIDISAHNGKIDFDSVKADTVSFVIIKATEGTDFCDANFKVNYKGAREAGLKVAPYHFFRFTTPGDVQASHFLGTISGLTFDMPLVLDVECWGNAAKYDVATVKKQLRKCVDIIRRAGYPLMIYTNKHDYALFIEGDFDDVDLWICSLSSRPPRHDWRLWQHSHRGRVAGVRGDVDIDTYNGNNKKFNKKMRQYKVSKH